MAEVGVAVVGHVAGEVATSCCVKIKQHFGYLFKYEDNLKSLKDAGKNLDAKRNDANRFFNNANRKQRDVSDSVVRWKEKVEELHQNAQNIITGNDISCFNLWSRYSSSKHAWKLTQEIDKKIEDAPGFGVDFDRPTPNTGTKFNLRGFIDFDSRLEVGDRVYEALKDEEVSMCSVCGMGGIGKTTLVKKLIKKVEADHLFDKVARVTVSQNVNLQAIQDQIIEQLGLKVDERTATARANMLNAWLTSKRILLVLDDVWRQLSDEEFDQIGIPLESTGCKIVLTSRNEDECKKMGSQKTFPIKVLQDGEAWELFQLYEGECVEVLNIQNTARKIANECDGLPIAIVTIATSLKDKPIGVWNDSLRQLQNSNLLGISGMEKVYSRIQLSYDLLQDKEAQSCFRLCCLFPEDYDVSVERLVFYGKGLELFENVDTIMEARDRVEMIIHKLKKSFLLLDGKEDGYIKMHDIVRDFAISFSSKDEHPYLVRCEHKITKWPETRQCENCSAISVVCSKIGEDLDLIDLRCPKLELLQLNFEDYSTVLPDNIFEGVKELKVVDWQGPTLIQPLTGLKKLRTLLIDYEANSWNEGVLPSIGDLLGDQGDLKNLEIFSYSGTGVYDFPVEIGLLCNLRCLRFQTVRFKYMPPGVLSKLVKLEELRLTSKFLDWGFHEGERVNASLNEIESLPLATLSIGVRNGSILAEKLVKSITRFQVYMGFDHDYQCNSDDADQGLIVSEADACDVPMSWMSCLLRKCKSLRLEKVRNLKNIMSLLSKTTHHSEEDNGFPQLNSLAIYECNEMEYLVNTTVEHIPSTFLSQLQMLYLSDLPRLKELWHGPCFSNIQASSFNVLTEISIRGCPKLKYVFPLPVAREMRQLQYMMISNCDKMEEIIYNVEPSVQLNAQTVETTPTPTLDPIDDKPQHICPTPNSFIRGLHGKRKQPKDISSHKVSTKINSNIKINCNRMEYLVDTIAELKTLFSQLETLKIEYMDSLKEIWHASYSSKIEATCFSNLSEIYINACSKLKHVFPLSVATELRQLRRMEILFCDEMEQVFYRDQVDDENDQMMEENIVKSDEREVDRVIIFPQLTVSELEEMPMLRNFYDGNHAIELPSLEELIIKKCDKMEALSYRSFHTTTMKKIQIDGITYRARQNLFSDKVWEKCSVSGDDAKANLTKMSWVMSGLVANCESLMVNYVGNLKWLLHSEPDNRFPLLKNIELFKCKEMEYLVDTIAELKTLFSQLETLNIDFMDSLKEIWHASYSSKIEATCFGNLSELRIGFCSKLRHVFPLSVATELRQLQHMGIQSCDEMEQVFYRDQVDDENDQVASGAELSTTSTTTLMNSTSNSIIPGLLGKGKQPKNISSHHQVRNSDWSIGEFADNEENESQ